MSDGFLVLAQAPGGLTCFLVPRVLADGTRNVFLLQRLKDKLGNRSNASAEVEFDGTWARRVGDEGAGVRTIIGMVAATRLDCVLGSAGLMRQAVAQAVHHTAHREAFGGTLMDKPLMRNVLADLALESEAATALGLRLAAAYDDGGEQEAAFLRLAVPAAKYWVTKRCSPVTVEAAECLGGNGYVEESGLPRLVRESPLNSIWEGAGNIQALDVLRALRREPQALNAFLIEVGRVRGADHRLDGAMKNLLAEFADLDGIEGRARRLVERMALVLQGRCSSSTRRPRSPTPSARPGWAATGAPRSAPCRRAWTSRRSPSGPGRRSEATPAQREGGAAPTRHHPRSVGQVSDTVRPFTRVAEGCNLAASVSGLSPSVTAERHYENNSRYGTGEKDPWRTPLVTGRGAPMSTRLGRPGCSATPGTPRSPDSAPAPRRAR